jgi:hypothetical protein
MEQAQENNQGNPQQVQVKIPDEVAKGVYANMAIVGHSPSGEEFVMDFMSIFPPAGMVNARVIMSPGHYKRLLAAMQEQMKKFEEQFGSVKPAEGIDHKIGFRTE